MEDNTIIKLLYERSDKALEQLSQKYSGLYKKVIREVLCDESDIEECENDVLLAVWNSIPPKNPDNLSSYVCKIARNIGINRFKHNTRKRRNAGYTIMLSELDECIPDALSLHEFEVAENDGKIDAVLSDFIRNLDAETRVLFVRKYIFFESVSSLSERFNMKENVISVKLFRARKKLKKELLKEGIYV